MLVCKKCKGEGFYMGQGFMMTDCTICSGSDLPSNKPPTLDKINRKSKSYQKAIKDIMDINPAMSREEAIKMFDDAYVKC